MGWSLCPYRTQETLGMFVVPGHISVRNSFHSGMIPASSTNFFSAKHTFFSTAKRIYQHTDTADADPATFCSLHSGCTTRYVKPLFSKTSHYPDSLTVSIAPIVTTFHHQTGLRAPLQRRQRRLLGHTKGLGDGRSKQGKGRSKPGCKKRVYRRQSGR